MSQTDIVIVGAARTPIANLGGYFKTVTAPELGAVAIHAAIQRSQLPAHRIEEVLMGCVLSAGLGQAPARQAALSAGLSHHTPCTTINKMCGSGMKAALFAHDEILAGSFKTIIAGGMENMSQAPYLMPNARFGYRLGHGQLIDHMMLDGLEDAYDRGKSMGVFAEMCVDKYQFTRKELDEFAIQSLQRAEKANEDGTFSAEIVPVNVVDRKGNSTQIQRDENPFQAKIERIPELKPAFRVDGKITPANSSSISDGAAALVLTSREQAEQNHCRPLAKIVAHHTYAQEPAWFTTAPINAIKGVLQKASWSSNEVDLFEINEAFAVVTLSAIRDLKLDPKKVNVHGGACALGHPIGASGARIIVTLIYALQKYKLKRGIAALCIGGGEATAIAIEML
ncbi:MAG: acetyl-CoA acetyltransferase [Gammaproteobacteria bacterium RIFCSPHIGHO2_12_FULL_41_15]|nr:MAG: acetyl-CoA acetyltransferase [Gammaproteobacteria bacterium RIFCSPHIGHO2_12_FULL_41_15]